MAEKIMIDKEQIFDCRLSSDLMYLKSKDQKRLNLENANGTARLAFLGMVENEATETFKPYQTK